MPAGWEIIRRADNSDGDIVALVDYWSIREMNVTRNALKLLGSLRHTQYFSLTRDTITANATEVLLPNHGFPVTIDWTQIQPSGVQTFQAIVSVMLKTNGVATSVECRIKRTSGTPANVLTFGPYNGSTAWTLQATQAFPVTETGTQTYEAYVYGSDGANDVGALAKVDFYAP